jgi:hypothetical protein
MRINTGNLRPSITDWSCVPVVCFEKAELTLQLTEWVLRTCGRELTCYNIPDFWCLTRTKRLELIFELSWNVLRDNAFKSLWIVIHNWCYVEPLKYPRTHSHQSGIRHNHTIRYVAKVRCGSFGGLFQGPSFWLFSVSSRLGRVGVQSFLRP